MTTHTQRVIVPGGNDRVTTQLLGREKFERLRGSWPIPLGGSLVVTRAGCFWSEQHNTISLLPWVAARLGLQIDQTHQGEPGTAEAQPSNMQENE